MGNTVTKAKFNHRYRKGRDWKRAQLTRDIRVSDCVIHIIAFLWWVYCINIFAVVRWFCVDQEIVPSSMASGLVRCALYAVLEDKELQMTSTRIDGLKELGKSILEKIVKGESEMAAFDAFSSELTTALRSILHTSVTYRSSAAERGAAWRTFHQVRLSKLPELWDSFLSEIKIEASDQLLQQSFNQKLFEMILPGQCSLASSLQHGNVQDCESPLSKDELNAMQYACGYVPHALLRRYEKRNDRKFDKFIECLGDMAVQSESASDVLGYTKEWIDKANRGGLFPLNDITFLFFVSVEVEVHRILPVHMMKPLESSDRDAFKQGVIEKIVQNEDVQFHWTLLSHCIDSEKEAIELLREIVTLWVTVRGFSITATWMEVYKQETKKKSKKIPGLRKGLSRPAI